MARTPKDFQVDGVKYTTSLYSFDTSIEIGEKLGMLLAEPLAAVVDSGGLKADVDAVLIKGAIGGLMTGLQNLDTVQLIKDILQTTKKIDNNERRPISFDLDFAGEHLHMFKVLKEVVAFQYADLFGMAAGAGDMLRQGKKTIKAKKAG